MHLIYLYYIFVISISFNICFFSLLLMGNCNLISRFRILYLTICFSVIEV